MKKNNIFYILLSLLTLSACSEDAFQTVVEFEVPVEQQRIVVNTNYTVGKDSIVVYLSRSRTTSEPITTPTDTFQKAKVTLLKDGVAFKDMVFEKAVTASDRDQVVQYLYKFYAIVDKNLPQAKYTLKASVEGYDDITADDVLPIAVPITNVRFEASGFESLVVNIGGKPTKTIKDLLEISINDPIGSNYYLIEVRSTSINQNGDVQQRVVNFDMNQQFTASRNGFSGNKAIIPDQTFDGKPFKIQLGVNSKGGGKGGGSTVTEYEVIMRSVSRNTYLFEQSLAAYNINSNNPFADPTVLHTNVFKGYGLFSLEQKSVFKLKI